MGEKESTAPPRLRSVWMFLALFGVVIVTEVVVDRPVLTIISAVFGVFAIGYFLRYYMRTGRNVLHDAAKNRDA